MRHAAEGEAVVRVDDEKGRPPGVGEQVPRVEAAVLLHMLRAFVVLKLGLHVPLRGHQHAAEVVAGVLRLRSDGEEAVSRDVEQQHSVRRQFFSYRGRFHRFIRKITGLRQRTE